MQILIIPPTLNYQNLGDIALLQVAVRRLRACWPQAELRILAGGLGAAEEMNRHLPDVHSVQYANAWFGETFLLGPVHRALPARVSRLLGALKRYWYRHSMSLAEISVKLRLARHPERRAEFKSFTDSIRSSDAVVAAGAGGLNDLFVPYSRMLLSTLELAQASGKPTAVFSHGMGPLRDPALVSRAARVFRRLAIVGLREACTGRPLVDAMGVRPDQVVITGDDAIELAYEARPERPGTHLGVNLRVGPNTGVSEGFARELGARLRQFAACQGVRLLPLPIARSKGADSSAISMLLGEEPDDDVNHGVGTPRDVIERAGACRVVITAAYHAAVFALAQGVPAVCLSGSEYFRLKFAGLAEQFGSACQLVEIMEPDAVERVMQVLEQSWQQAGEKQLALTAQACQQIRASEGAYRCLAAALQPQR